MKKAQARSKSIDSVSLDLGPYCWDLGGWTGDLPLSCACHVSKQRFIEL
jgi:hypothetical protein